MVCSISVTGNAPTDSSLLLRFLLQVNLKYDAWQKELQGSFATILAEETRQVRPSFYFFYLYTPCVGFCLCFSWSRGFD